MSKVTVRQTGSPIRRKSDQRATLVDRPLQQHDGIGAHETAVVIGIARARPGPPRPYPAQHRTRIAPHDAVSLRGAEFLRTGIEGVGGGDVRIARP